MQHNLVFSHLGFWSGNLFLIVLFPSLCLRVFKQPKKVKCSCYFVTMPNPPLPPRKCELISLISISSNYESFRTDMFHSENVMFKDK